VRVSYHVISTYNDANENPDVWPLRVPKQYRYGAPTITPAPDGGRGWGLEGLSPKGSFVLRAVATRRPNDHNVERPEARKYQAGQIRLLDVSISAG